MTVHLIETKSLLRPMSKTWQLPHPNPINLFQMNMTF